MRLRIKHIVLISGIVFLVFLFLGFVLPPLTHKKGKESGRRSESIGSENSYDGERILCIDDNREALIWRLKAIQEADEEIILSTFDFGDDNSGSDMMAALLHAADRGVRIRLLVDGINGTLNLSGSNHFKALVSSPNVEAKFYNPIHLLTPWKANYRMHDKYLIVDNRIYIMGGRNTNDLFLGNYRDSYNIDRDILVYHERQEGDTSLMELREYFKSVWAHVCNKEVVCEEASEKIRSAGTDLRNHFEEIKQLYPEAFETTDWIKETMEAESVALCTGSVEPSNKAPEVWDTLCRHMEKGGDVVIQTPYIICSRDMYRDITALCQEGKSIKILTNGVENGANPWGCTDYLNQKGNILSTGAEVYEISSDQSLHTKTILLDDRISMAGSYNLDIRSTYLDTEMMLIIDSPELNQYLRSEAELLMSQSKHVFPDGTETYGEQYREKEISFGKKCMYSLLRVIIYPFRYLL